MHINLFILDHNGNLIDCASIAAVTALLHFKRPEVAINGNEVTAYSTADREPVSLSIHHIPIAITFALFDGGCVDNAHLFLVAHRVVVETLLRWIRA